MVPSLSPAASLDVNGEIKLGNATRPAEAGMVRWNATTNDFEGYDGTDWRSFTKAGSTWGNQPVNEGIEDEKIFASDGAVNDEFGFSVAIDGDYAVIGAHKDDFSFSNEGSAYIFFRSGNKWNFQQKLSIPNVIFPERFGMQFLFLETT